jgi:transcriptional regulator with XRE-family HTH domain
MDNGRGNGGGSVVHRRILGRRLRLLREHAGLTLEEAAPQLDWSTSTLSRIENGQQAPHVHGVRSMMDLYGLAGEKWDDLLQLTREVRQKGWWRAYGMDDFSYVGFETEASSVLDFTLAYVPGLLQIPEYSEALFVDSGVHRTPAQVADAVAVRTIRQERLTADDRPLELLAIFDESVLTRPIGGREVLGAQLRHVVEAAGLPSVTVQVLPHSVGAHPALASAFTLLRFEHLGEPDIAYVEHTVGALQLEKVADVDRARLVFDRLRSAALDPEQSLARIREAAAQV